MHIKISVIFFGELHTYKFSLISHNKIFILIGYVFFDGLSFIVSSAGWSCSCHIFSNFFTIESCFRSTMFLCTPHAAMRALKACSTNSAKSCFPEPLFALFWHWKLKNKFCICKDLNLAMFLKILKKDLNFKNFNNMI